MFDSEYLNSIIKAYDVRGLVKSQITPDFAFVLGGAYARFLQEEREPSRDQAQGRKITRPQKGFFGR
jgi:phosphomannomutase